MNTYIYIHTYVLIYIHVYTYIYIEYIYMNTYIYIYINIYKKYVDIYVYAFIDIDETSEGGNDARGGDLPDQVVAHVGHQEVAVAQPRDPCWATIKYHLII